MSVERVDVLLFHRHISTAYPISDNYNIQLFFIVTIPSRLARGEHEADGGHTCGRVVGIFCLIVGRWHPSLCGSPAPGDAEFHFDLRPNRKARAGLLDRDDFCCASGCRGKSIGFAEGPGAQDPQRSEPSSPRLRNGVDTPTGRHNRRGHCARSEGQDERESSRRRQARGSDLHGCPHPAGQ
jgi:hypothetical protein